MTSAGRHPNDDDVKEASFGCRICTGVEGPLVVAVSSATTFSVGANVLGLDDGLLVLGAKVGINEGASLGSVEGHVEAVGGLEGPFEGKAEGETVGEAVVVGCIDGAVEMVGTLERVGMLEIVGLFEGAMEWDGAAEGAWDGGIEGKLVVEGELDLSLWAAGVGGLDPSLDLTGAALGPSEITSALTLGVG